MTNLTKIVTFALTTVVVTTSMIAAASAFTLPTFPPTRIPHSFDKHHSDMTVECRVHDADFWIQNFGGDNLDSGRQIAWRSPTTGDEGVILLPKMLAPGEEVKLADVLSDDALAGAPCAVALV
jgi:hypothetical protein